MASDPDIWILLVDPHEAHDVDGLWGAGIAQLAEESPEDAWVLTEDRIRPCVQQAARQARVRVPAAGGPSARLRRIAPDAAGLLDLLFLRERIPRDLACRSIRAFGLRAGVLGRQIAASLGKPLIATLAAPARPPQEETRSSRALRVWHATLAAWVADGACRVETPSDRASARLDALLLHRAPIVSTAPLPTRDRRSGPFRHRQGAPEGSTARSALHLAVRPVSREIRVNRILLQAIRGLPEEVLARTRIHWLARRHGFSSFRARQWFRRWRLAPLLQWEDEPWLAPPHLREVGWDLLIGSAAEAETSPMTQRYLSAGGTFLSSDPLRSDRGDMRRADFAVKDWTDRIEALLGDRREPGIDAGRAATEKGGERCKPM